MHTYAQTNIQLYNQIQNECYSGKDLKKVRDAYELAICLFCGHFRSNGKPFLSHLIGTASILVAHNAPVNVVVAGLLHAVYALGRFSDLRKGATAGKQQRVVSIVGAETEEIILKYTDLKWNLENIQSFRVNISSLSILDRNVLTIRLANELEDRLDLGMVYNKKESKFPSENVVVTCELARDLGLAGLADEIEKIFHEMETSMDTPATMIASARVSYVVDTPLLWQIFGIFIGISTYTAKRIRRLMR